MLSVRYLNDACTRLYMQWNKINVAVAESASQANTRSVCVTGTTVYVRVSVLGHKAPSTLHTSNNVEATLSNATMSNVDSTMSNVASTLLPKTATLSKQQATKLTLLLV